jgi:hypothetical protein
MEPENIGPDMANLDDESRWPTIDAPSAGSPDHNAGARGRQDRQRTCRRVPSRGPKARIPADPDLCPLIVPAAHKFAKYMVNGKTCGEFSEILFLIFKKLSL